MTDHRHRIVAGVLVLGLAGAQAQARLVRIEIESVTSTPQADGLPYETLRGRYFGEVDLRHAHNTIITDLAKAPRNANGKVAYWGARPVNPADASGVLIYDIPS